MDIGNYTGDNMNVVTSSNDAEAAYRSVVNNRLMYMDLVEDESPWTLLAQTPSDFNLSAAFALDVFFGRGVLARYIAKYYPDRMNDPKVVYFMMQELDDLESGSLFSTFQFFLKLKPNVNMLSELYWATVEFVTTAEDATETFDLLYLNGVPVPEDMNGALLAEIEKSGDATSHMLILEHGRVLGLFH